MRVYISAKWSDLNITTNTTSYDKERGGIRKSRFAAEGGKSNSQRCCLCCWCNDVIAIISHRVHTQTDSTTNLSISSNVHNVHLGGDNNPFGVSVCKPSQANVACWLGAGAARLTTGSVKVQDLQLTYKIRQGLSNRPVWTGRPRDMSARQRRLKVCMCGL